ncbi:hypothetical protein M3G15_19185 [Paenibacillus sp. p3-SID1389]|uniref:hypothetical protein n=1 Tax=Paenibacillus sp. p3-SID1389 TaxID=2916364 RepID=UPI0021A65E4C|nr:hypothetical protein [Paenibacillus sp. p3-SID1389]MCT2197238.1 hypothetical protein [Paenibacillus sp. p3-SID1389]
MTQTTVKSKPWWEPKSTALLKEYARTSGGTYAAGTFRNWKYKGQHVRLPLSPRFGSCKVTITDPNNDTSGNEYAITVKYSYRPRRKLEFVLFSAKRHVLAWFTRGLREASLPNSGMNKKFQAKASHPSLLRSVLKYEGIEELLNLHSKIHVRLRIKNGRATLTCTEKLKKPDVPAITATVELMKKLLLALEDQGIIGDPLTPPKK